MAEIDDPNDDEPMSYRDPVGLHGVHLLTCRALWYDAQRTDGAFGLAGIMTHIEPSEEASFPVSLNRVFVYVQLWGDAGEYTLRIRLVRVILEDDDEVEVQLGMNDEPREYPLPSHPGLFHVAVWVILRANFRHKFGNNLAQFTT